MKRTLSILLLALLVLPYARAEICSAAGHEHPGEEQHAGDEHAGDGHAGDGHHHDHYHHAAGPTMVAESGHDADESECHRLMACDTTVQVVLPSATVASRLEPHVATEVSRAPAHVDEPAKAPVPPPPQSV
jgi:hypothetical protein